MFIHFREKSAFPIYSIFVIHRHPMKKSILLCLIILASCDRETKQNSKVNETNQLFEAYKQSFVEELWKLNPEWASGVGYHNYDSVLVVPDEAQRARDLAFAQANLDSLKTFDLNQLSPFNKTDYYLIRDQLNAMNWNINELKIHEWNPSTYNVSGVFAEMLNNNYDSLDTRLMNFYKRMSAIPAYYEAAKKNIRQPTEEHRELAISQNLGGASVFEADLAAAVSKSQLNDELKSFIIERGKESAKVIRDFAEWLKTFKNPSPRSFRLGEKLYTKKFELDIQSGYSATEVFEKALARKAELHEKMYAITTELWPKYFKDKAMPEDKLKAIREMIDILSLRHAHPDSFQVAIEKQIPELVDFVNKKQLIYLDPSKPLVVRNEPAYMAGLAGASISSPGPYDINGNTYYNVGSLSGWPKEKAESYLREYNHYILQILNIHEAIPGHYTQLIYSNASATGNNKSDAGETVTDTKYPGIIKSILGNGAMIEGWAVYSELMMLENGYGAPKGGEKAEPEMWLMYYKWNLRSTCNTILDYSVHAKNMSKEEAIKLLTEEAFQQQAEAEGKWRRATLSQVQLCSYFTGFVEILDFREELKNKMGEKFNLKEFHEKFLSYGSAPVKYIRELMLEELKASKAIF